MSTQIDKSLILNEIKSLYGFKSDAEFARFLEIKPTTLSTWHARNTFDADLLYAKCERVDGNFMLTGRGEIERGSGTVIQEPDAKYLLRTDRKRAMQTVPLYDFKASAGLTTLFNDKHPDILDYISIPNLPKVDGAISITGDSMYPLLKAGDIVMYKIYNNNIENIFWGEIYLISYELDGDIINTVKFLQQPKGKEGYITLVSQNVHHSDKDIKMSSVKALALIKASIRINTLA